MISWQWFCYKILLFSRFIQILFLNGHRSSDEYARLVETYLKSTSRSLDFKNYSAFNFSSSSITRTNLFPILSGEIPSLFFAIIRLYSKNPSTLFFTVISPYFMQRYFSFGLSLLIDYFLFRISKYWRVKPNLVMFLFSSSYVPWIFFTFSRSSLIETILFGAFLFFVTASISFGATELNANERGHGHGHSHGQKNCTGNSIEDDDDDQDSPKNISKCALFLGFIFACGVSNRLNFAIFALAPSIQWFLGNETKKREKPFWIFCRKLGNFLFGLTIGLFSISLIDSTILGRLEMGELIKNLQNLTSFKFTSTLARNNLTSAAWNSLRVALTYRNIANQSIHPWYTHILINCPLVFGPFGFCILIYFFQCFRLDILWRLHFINARYWFLLSSFVVPLIALSIYPRQNPEDLCPLLIPLILVVVIRVSQYNFRTQARLISVWCVWNCFGLLYYGLLYNGALYECVASLENYRINYRLRMTDKDFIYSDKLISGDKGLDTSDKRSIGSGVIGDKRISSDKRGVATDNDVAFAYHFFAIDQPPSSLWFYSDPGAVAEPRIFYYGKDEGSKFERRLKYTAKMFSDIYVVAPSTVSLCHLWSKKREAFGNMYLVETYSWHFSPEAAPDFWQLFGCSISDKGGDKDFASTDKARSGCEVPCMENKWRQLREMLTLKVYRFEKAITDKDDSGE